MEVRKARVEDAPAICEIIRRSIIELCNADHHNDPAILDRWLANKTPESIAVWATQPHRHLLVVEDGNPILAAGSVTEQGEITLNYVCPSARLRGVSKMLMAALEAKARELGNEVCTLTSTETAHRFYLAAGYVDQGPPEGKFGSAGGYSMKKRLATPS
jgi:GNAT superfamily N-acetyltransferase